MGRAEFLRHTRAELLFIAKEWESSIVSRSTFDRNATLNAIANAFRQKGEFIELWQSEDGRRIPTREEAQKQFDEIEDFYKKGGD